MRPLCWGMSCAVAWGILGGAEAAIGSDLGRRDPSEKRTLVDARSGLTVTALTTSPAPDTKIYQTHPQWTPDGAFIVFLSSRRGNREQVFAVSETTGEIVQLTDEPRSKTRFDLIGLARRANRMYFFRDNRVLVEVDLDHLLGDSAADAMKASKEYERTIMTLPESVEALSGFSLDADDRGGYIAYPLPGKKEWAIRSIDFRNGATARVIDAPFRVGHVQANPWVHGELLYCHETGGDAPQRMWYVRGDGTGNQPLYKETPEEWVTHEVIVDRDHVLFNLSAGQPRLRTHPTGIALINIRTQEMGLIGQAPGSGFWHCAATPDRKWAVGDTHHGELDLINIETGERTLLTSGHVRQGLSVHSHHNISPDGRRVLFNSPMLGSADLMTVPLEVVRTHESVPPGFE